MRRTPLRRKSKLEQRTPLTRRTPLSDSSSLRPVSRDRDRKRGAVFMPLSDAVREMRCEFRNDHTCWGASEVHHVLTRGARWGDWVYAIYAGPNEDCARFDGAVYRSPEDARLPHGQDCACELRPRGNVVRLCALAHTEVGQTGRTAGHSTKLTGLLLASAAKRNGQGYLAVHGALT